MKRRTLLAGAAVLGPVLAGCSLPFGSSASQIYVLDRSMPLQLINAFQKRNGAESRLTFEAEENLFDLFQRLQSWQRPDEARGSRLPLPQPAAAASPAMLVSLGDYWLSSAIERQLIQPIAVADLPGWSQLAPLWPALVQRDRSGQPSPQAEVWGVPYRWGSLQIVYNRRYFEQLGWQPQGWADLLRPELQQQLALPDHPRLGLGIALKSLGASASTADPGAIAALPQRLSALHQQARFYSDTHYLEPLVLEDIAVAVGWSTDILPLLQKYRQFAAVVPTEGTLLSADLWVRPAPAPKTPAAPLAAAAQAWLQYSLEPQVALELTLYSLGASPLFWAQAEAALPEALRGRPLLTLTPALQQRSEFLLPLPEPAAATYRQLWQTARSAT